MRTCGTTTPERLAVADWLAGHGTHVPMESRGELIAKTGRMAVPVITVGDEVVMGMAVTMQCRWILIPAGIVGVLAGSILHFRERTRCDALACHNAGSRITIALLVLAAFIVTNSSVLDRFVEMTSNLIAPLRAH